MAQTREAEFTFGFTSAPDTGEDPTVNEGDSFSITGFKATSREEITVGVGDSVTRTLPSASLVLVVSLNGQPVQLQLRATEEPMPKVLFFAVVADLYTSEALGAGAIVIGGNADAAAQILLITLTKYTVA